MANYIYIYCTMGALMTVQHIDFQDSDGSTKRAAVVNFNVGAAPAEPRVEVIDESQHEQKPVLSKNEELRYSEKLLIDAGMLDDYITKPDDEVKKKRKKRKKRNNRKKY